MTRDYHLSLTLVNEELPLISAYGGKLTTYRVLAEDVMKMLKPYIPNLAKSWTATKPLPGGDIPNGNFKRWFDEFAKDFDFLGKSLLRHLGRTYGTEAMEILEGVKSKSDMGHCFGGNFHEQEAFWLIENEMAKAPDDILFRRTKHGLFLTKEQRIYFENWTVQNT